MFSVTVFSGLLGSGFQQCNVLGLGVQQLLFSLAKTFQSRYATIYRDIWARRKQDDLINLLLFLRRGQ
jgi:hypothetical protein